MVKAIHVSPMVPSYDVKDTIHFFEDIFGFTVFAGDENYAVLRKDDVFIHIIKAGDIGEMSFYLEIEEIDKWWASAESKLKSIKVTPPFDREYGMREAHINIPNTQTQLFVGQPLN
ncbi:MAG: hypothetical protein ACHQHN_05455 [Sphingobacteriales bacterium]